MRKIVFICIWLLLLVLATLLNFFWTGHLVSGIGVDPESKVVVSGAKNWFAYLVVVLYWFVFSMDAFLLSNVNPYMKRGTVLLGYALSILTLHSINWNLGTGDVYFALLLGFASLLLLKLSFYESVQHLLVGEPYVWPSSNLAKMGNKRLE